MLGTVREVLQSWAGIYRRQKAWRVVPLALMWVIEFVKRNIGTYTPLLAGNSVYMDFQFPK
ncbi:hypothetical protein H5410_046471, partial [Solanum commersonii]